MAHALFILFTKNLYYGVKYEKLIGNITIILKLKLMYPLFKGLSTKYEYLHYKYFTEPSCGQRVPCVPEPGLCSVRRGCYKFKPGRFSGGHYEAGSTLVQLINGQVQMCSSCVG